MVWPCCQVLEFLKSHIDKIDKATQQDALRLMQKDYEMNRILSGYGFPDIKEFELEETDRGYVLSGELIREMYEKDKARTERTFLDSLASSVSGWGVVSWDKRQTQALNHKMGSDKAKKHIIGVMSNLAHEMKLLKYI